MASKEQLIKVAHNCSQYDFIGRGSFKSGTAGDINRSCENCEHFTKDHKCNINLVDEILTNLAMEVDKDYF